MKLYFALLLFIIPCTLIYSQTKTPIDAPVFQINTFQDTFNLMNYAQVWTDHTGTTQFSETQQQDFQSLKQFNPSIDENIFWLRLKVKNNLDYSTDWRLFLFEGWLEK